MRRLFEFSNKTSNKKILKNAKLTIDWYAKIEREERLALSKLSTLSVEIILHSRLLILSRRSIVLAKVKESQDASKALLKKSVNQGNLTKSRNEKSLKSQGVKMSLSKFMKLMQDVLLNINITKEIAKLVMIYEIYLRDKNFNKKW